ncbi:MAG TPA: alpha/beta hydrolase [Syntrophobacteria bacterium]|nr:alpha/beta hydrolase [Syntrophobacteria bacterium]
MDLAARRHRLIERIGIPVEQGRLAAGGIGTHYLKAGRGPCLVLLHGAGGSSLNWSPVMAALAAKCCVIAPDMVGYGESDKPAVVYDRPFFAAWLRHFLDALGLEKPILLGHSQGGAVALQFAIEHSERLQRLILVCPAGLSVDGIPFGAKLGILWVNFLPSRLAAWWMSRYICANGRSEWDGEITGYLLEVKRLPRSKRVFLAGLGKSIAPFSTEALQGIAHPTLIVWGRQDRLLLPAHGARACREIPASRLCLIPGAGHLPFVDQPQPFCDAVLGFVNDQPRRHTHEAFELSGAEDRTSRWHA